MGPDTVELLLAFGHAFGIEIPNEVGAKLVSVRDVQNYVLAEYARQGRTANPDAIFEKIRAMTADITGVERNKISLDSTFVDGLGLD